ncbi:MAG: hypothetical protein KDB79_08290 [Acidobacteria bacterium]|nr:hypothetical protein [Acidobacteriota bacterium]
MNLFTRIICLVLLFSAFLFFFFQTTISSQSIKQDVLLTQQAEKITGDEFKFSTKSPKGTRIISVRKATPEMIAAIDKGLSDLFQIARSKKYRYKKRLNHSDYTIFISNSDRQKNAAGNYSPDIAVAADQYAGSKYDKGGYVYAAGMVVALNPCAFVIAEHVKDFERVSEVVRYETEHLVLYHNDRKFFRETADHSKGGGHPILN